MVLMEWLSLKPVSVSERGEWEWVVVLVGNCLLADAVDVGDRLVVECAMGQ